MSITPRLLVAVELGGTGCFNCMSADEPLSHPRSLLHELVSGMQRMESGTSCRVYYGLSWLITAALPMLPRLCGS